jgi:hypothetical protein
MRAMVEKGAVYVGHNGAILNDALDDLPHDDACIFHFNSAIFKNDPLWQANYDLMMNILQSRSSRTLPILYDYAATSEVLDKVHVSHY